MSFEHHPIAPVPDDEIQENSPDLNSCAADTRSREKTVSVGEVWVVERRSVIGDLSVYASSEEAADAADTVHRLHGPLPIQGAPEKKCQECERLKDLCSDLAGYEVTSSGPEGRRNLEGPTTVEDAERLADVLVCVHGVPEGHVCGMCELGGEVEYKTPAEWEARLSGTQLPSDDSKPLERQLTEAMQLLEKFPASTQQTVLSVKLGDIRRELIEKDKTAEAPTPTEVWSISPSQPPPIFVSKEVALQLNPNCSPGDQLWCVPVQSEPSGDDDEDDLPMKEPVDLPVHGDYCEANMCVCELSEKAHRHCTDCGKLFSTRQLFELEGEGHFCVTCLEAKPKKRPEGVTTPCAACGKTTQLKDTEYEGLGIYICAQCNESRREVKKADPRLHKGDRRIDAVLNAFAYMESTEPKTFIQGAKVLLRVIDGKIKP